MYGLLYNGSGGLTQTQTSTIRGSVLLGGDYSAADSCSVQYDGDLLEKLIHSALSFTVSFDSNGGSEIEPMQANSGQALGALPVPNKADSIFLGWYTDNNSFEQAVTKDTPVISDLTLYARYAEIGGVQEADQDTSVSAMDREPSFAIQVASSDTGMSAEAVKVALQLEVPWTTPRLPGFRSPAARSLYGHGDSRLHARFFVQADADRSCPDLCRRAEQFQKAFVPTASP